MKKDVYIKDLEERVSNLEVRLDNYNFFIVKNISSYFCIDTEGSDNTIILRGIGNERLVLKMNLYCACKVKGMPIDVFVEWVRRETGADLQFFHGEKIFIANRYQVEVQDKHIEGTFQDAGDLLRSCPWGEVVSKHIAEFEYHGR